MNIKIEHQKCKRHNLRMKWLCIYKNCNEPLFCIKCRKTHDKNHESHLYPLKEIIENDEDGQMENSSNEEIKMNLDKKIKLEIEKICSQINQTLNQNSNQIINNIITEEKKNGLETNLNEMRKKYHNNQSDLQLLLKIGHQYHRYIHDSKINEVDQNESVSFFQNILSKKFNQFKHKINSLIREFINGDMDNSENTQNFTSIDKHKIDKKSIPHQWKQPLPENLIEKSLISVKASKVKYNEVHSEHQ